MKYLVVFLSVLLSTVSYSQNKKSIRWSKDTLLTWNDFGASVDTSIHYFAFAATGIGYRYDPRIVNGQRKYVFSTSSSFSRTRSWSIAENQTPELLKHEQLHFDIVEYFARQLLIALNRLSSMKHPEQQIFSTYRQIRAIKDKIQIVYDNSTNHGMESIMQKKWEQYVNTLLESNTPLEEALNNPLFTSERPK